PHLQAKLLKFLEERRFYGADPHGSEGPDVRLVTSSTRQLKALVHEGRFLRELYYHLNLVEVEIPPLRQRREDIPILIGQRMAELNAKYGKELAVSEALADRMSRHPWKGNIRELFNAIERMHLLKMSGELGEEDFRRIMAHEKDVGVDTPAAGPLHEVLEDVEERLILDALYKTGGNQSKAAEMLGISRNALIYRLKRMKR
ncbi:MAG TPA: helix-turn-helix domain-containing protein, partial [Paenibacillaceae bacterium]